MATSGTVAQTQISVETLISHAFGRCGKLPSTVGGELLARAREALYFIVADLGNDGINLWSMTKSVMNVVANQVPYQLPVGTESITTALYRTLWSLPGTVIYSASAATVDVQSPQPVNNVTGRFTAPGSASLLVQYSLDNLVWVTLTDLQPITVIAGAVFTIDLDKTADAQYWRIADASGTIVAMDNVRFRKTNTELTMAKLNKTDYENLPNKQYRGQKALQYWFDKQIEPRVWVWPMSNQTDDQLVFWLASQVQDPGDLTNELAVPTRWYRAVTASLSVDVAFLIPPSELPQGRLTELKVEKIEAMRRALDGESDGSSYKISPNISPYTK